MLLGVFYLILAAQDPGSVEGRVTTSVGHTGIGGVAVTAGGLHTTTDSSGTFGLTGLPAGAHQITFEAAGFFRYETRVRLDSSIASAPLSVELTPHSSITGRVVDAEGEPATKVHIEITEAIRGTGNTWSSGARTPTAKGGFAQTG